MANVDGNTEVSLSGGTINGDVYGGGKGRLESGTVGQDGYASPVAATVGAASVELNKDVADGAKGCVVNGNIFGCNNLNGTPLGDVTVHVYATQNAAATRITNVPNGDQTAKVKGRYDVKAVYGGGNLAAYIPTDLANSTTNVIIDGCDSTSIRQVYGGGNAASTPATNVVANATFEVEELFGGGNGKDSITVNGVKLTSDSRITQTRKTFTIPRRYEQPMRLSSILMCMAQARRPSTSMVDWCIVSLVAPTRRAMCARRL